MPVFQPSEKSKTRPAESTLAAFEYLRRLGDRELLQRFLAAHPELGACQKMED
jgi:hypothetical protein